MKSKPNWAIWTLYFGIVSLWCCGSPPAIFGQATRVFLVVNTSQGPGVESKEIADGETLVFDQPNLVAVVYTLGEGKSCDLVQAAKGPNTFHVTNQAGVLDIQVVRGNSKKSLPPMDTKSLRRTAIRVNIKTGNSQDSVFKISGYERVFPDDGPVVDMFGGKIPLQAGDVSITYETSALTHETLTGTMTAKLNHGWLLTTINLPDGKSGKVVIDTAATSSVLGQSALGPGTVIKKLESIEYSSDGEKRAAATMSAATGTVDQSGFLGKASLANVDCGGLNIPTLECSVLKSLPQELVDLGIIGIIGLDVLAAGNRLEISRTSDDAYELVLGGEPFDGSDTAASTVQDAFGLWFFDAICDDQKVKLLLDTGARYSILHEPQWQKLDRPGKNQNSPKTVSGLGGHKLSMDQYRFGSIIACGQTAEKWDVLVGKIQFFDSLGLVDVTGICGMDTLSRFDSIQIDFTNHKLVIKSRR